MSRHYIFNASGFLTGVAEGGDTPACSTILPPVYVEEFTPQFLTGAWVLQGVPPQISPVEFKLLFTVFERVAIKASTDPVVQDFFEIVNDPRLTHVDLGLQSTKDALAYLTSKGLIAAERQAAILTGIAS